MVTWELLSSSEDSSLKMEPARPLRPSWPLPELTVSHPEDTRPSVLRQPRVTVNFLFEFVNVYKDSSHSRVSHSFNM